MPDPDPDRFCLAWRVRRHANEIVNLAIEEIEAAHRADRCPRRIGARTAPARRYYRHRAHAEHELERMKAEHGDALAACIVPVRARDPMVQFDFTDVGLPLPLHLKGE